MHIALIDSDRMVAQLVTQYLAEAGHRVSEVKPEIEALGHETYDFIVMDLHQLGQTQSRMYDDIRKHAKLSGLPCVLIAGRITLNDVQSSKKDPLASLLIKPFTKSVFEDAFNRCLRQSLTRSTLKPAMETQATLAEGTHITIAWREDVEKILASQQRIVQQLQLDPKNLYEIKLKELKARGEPSPQDMGALRKSILDLILIKSAVIIDHDQANQQLLRDYSKQNNILELDTYGDCEQALSSLQSKRYDFIMMDWSTEASGGLRLYNKLRSATLTERVPLLVFGKASELPALDTLLEEDPHLLVVEKPIQFKKLTELLVKLFSKSLCAKKLAESLEKVFQSSCSTALLKDLVQDVCNRMPALKLQLIHSVHRLLELGRMEEAERLARILIEQQELAIPASSVLAKICHLTERPQAAADLLRYVCALAPKRLERLLQAAESELALLHIDRAELYLDQADKIDPEHRKLLALRYLSKTMQTHSAELNHSSVKNLVSVLNTIGITFAKSQKPDEAIQYYQSALMIDAQRLDRGRLYFNLGLSYERAKDPDKALIAFLEAEKLVGQELPKVRIHIDHLQQKKA